MEIMYEYSTHPLRPLSELEVFIGNAVGKTGAQSKKQRDLSTSMKERFEREVVFTRQCIIGEEDYEDEDEDTLGILERAVACFHVSFERGRVVKGGKQLESFGVVAAAMCLRELEDLDALSS